MCCSKIEIIQNFMQEATLSTLLLIALDIRYFFTTFTLPFISKLDLNLNLLRLMRTLRR